jgi:hypothetical protein
MKPPSFRSHILRASFCFAVVTSCCAAGSVKLEVTSLEVVPRTDQSVTGEFEGWRSQPGRLVRVVLSSNKNLRKLRNARGLNVFFQAWRCSIPKERLSYLGLVYDSAGEIGERNVAPILESNRVWLYIAESGPSWRGNSSHDRAEPYDLRTGRDDVCVRIRGRNMVLQGFTSNVVRLPAKELVAKLN